MVKLGFKIEYTKSVFESTQRAKIDIASREKQPRI